MEFVGMIVEVIEPKAEKPEQEAKKPAPKKSKTEKK